MFIFPSVLSVYSRWSLVSGLRPCARTTAVHRTPLLANETTNFAFNFSL